MPAEDKSASMSPFEPASAPLVLIAFNRPDLLRRQLEIVRKHFQGRIFAIVDGPRPAKPGEAEKVEEVVGLFEGLQDPFEVTINRSGTNLGCYRRIKSGLDWVFSQVDRAIILEDDCMPSPQFFSFAGDLLEQYSQRKDVFSIQGTNLFPELSPPTCRFFFSRYPNSWGWATWARAWCQFIDIDSQWQDLRNSPSFRQSFRNLRSFVYWRQYFDRTYSGKIDSWFYRWILTCWANGGLSIYPSQNLIFNLGDGEDATNTGEYEFLRRPIADLDFSADKGAAGSLNVVYDQTLEDRIYSKSLGWRLRWLKRRGWKILWRYFLKG